MTTKQTKYRVIGNIVMKSKTVTRIKAVNLAKQVRAMGGTARVRKVQ